jgi:hypothetical protein
VLERQLQAAPLPTRAPASLVSAAELAIAAAIQAILGGQGGAPRPLARRPADFNVGALVQIFLVPDEVPTPKRGFLTTSGRLIYSRSSTTKYVQVKEMPNQITA